MSSDYEARMKVEGDKLFVDVRYRGVFTPNDLALVPVGERALLRGKRDVFETHMCFQLGNRKAGATLESIYERAPEVLDLLAEELGFWVERRIEPDAQLATLALGQINAIIGGAN